ncbi:MAG: hypothetical protein OXU20_20830 [Myxococcales bacterium]|nr:hypothetical protein [Myxococcales bacterium]
MVPPMGGVRQSWWLASLVCVVYGVPALSSGFDLDETVLIGFLAGSEQRSHTGISATNLWSFSNGTQEELATLQQGVQEGTQPWCTETARPRGKMQFLRVLPSLSLSLDYMVFGLDALGYHAHTLLWYLALLLVVGTLFERVLGNKPPLGNGSSGGRGWRRLQPTLATLALFLFAVDATHAEVIGRSATRHILMAAVFGFAGLLAHLRFRTSGSLRELSVSLGWFALGMLSSESIFQVVCYVAAFELVRRGEPLRTRVLSLLPLGLLSLFYVVMYRRAGYGAHGGGYVDLFRTPELFWATLPHRFAALANEELLSLPAVAGFHHAPMFLVGLDLPFNTRFWIAVLAVFGFGLALWALTRRVGQPARDAARWLALGGLLSLVPALMGQLGQRLLLVPSLGVAAGVAMILRELFRRGTGSTVLGYAVPLVFGCLLAVRGLAAPVALYTELLEHRKITRWIADRWRPPESQHFGRTVAHASPAPETSHVRDVVVVGAPAFSVPGLSSPPLRRVMDGQRVLRRTASQRWWYLSNNARDFHYVVKRTSESRLRVSVGEPRRPGGARTLWYGCGSSHGATNELMHIAVAPSHAGNLQSAEVAFKRSLDDPSLWLVTWQDGALRRVTVPAVGGRVEL